MGLFTKTKKVNIEELLPHPVKVSNSVGGSSGFEYHVSQHKCRNCGATFTLWYEQKKCPWCDTDHSSHMTTTYWACM